MFYILKRVIKKIKIVETLRNVYGYIYICILSLEGDVRDDSKLLESLRTFSERSLPHEPKWVNGSSLVGDNAIIGRETDPGCVS